MTCSCSRTQVKTLGSKKVSKHLSRQRNHMHQPDSNNNNLTFNILRASFLRY